MCALTLPMLLTSSGTVVATEKSKIQEWPFAGLSRGHTVVCVRGDASACCAEWCACRVSSERRSKICSKTGQNPEKFSASGGGLRRRLRRAQSSLRSLKSLMSSAHGQVLDLILEPLRLLPHDPRDGVDAGEVLRARHRVEAHQRRHVLGVFIRLCVFDLPLLEADRL